MTLLNTVLDIDWEMIESIDLERFTDVAKHKQNLHMCKLVIGTDGSRHIMKEPEVASPDVRPD